METIPHMKSSWFACLAFHYCLVAWWFCIGSSVCFIHSYSLLDRYWLYLKKKGNCLGPTNNPSRGWWLWLPTPDSKLILSLALQSWPEGALSWLKFPHDSSRIMHQTELLPSCLDCELWIHLEVRNLGSSSSSNAPCNFFVFSGHIRGQNNTSNSRQFMVIW